VARQTPLKVLSPEEALARVMCSVLDPYYKEGQRRIKAERRGVREEKKAEREDLMDLNVACVEVMEAAAGHVSGNGTLPYNARRLFYAVRDRIQALTTKRFNPDRGYDYFRNTILQEYQQKYGKLEGLYYDPRGRLHEPHGGAPTDMGTREVEAYRFPAHTFNKILYVEKKGQFPLLDSARLMERYDMAIMTGEGFATEAARRLLEQADKQEKMQIFVLHDADPAGYEIARTVREETARMPGYSVEVIDLGLTVQQAVGRGVEPEEFTRKKKEEKLFERLAEAGDQLAFEHFFGVSRTRMVDGKQKVVWEGCKRFELDKMSAPQTVALVEEGLKADGVLGKVVPPDDEMLDLAESIYRSASAGWADLALEEITGWAVIKEEIAREHMQAFKLDNCERYIRTRFKKDDGLSWRTALRSVFEDIHQAKHSAALKKVVKEKVIEALKEEGK
jgi:5S rRNA maturation endonuclease (ribonuclease M5)